MLEHDPADAEVDGSCSQPRPEQTPKGSTHSAPDDGEDDGCFGPRIDEVIGEADGQFVSLRMFHHTRVRRPITFPGGGMMFGPDWMPSYRWPLMTVVISVGGGGSPPPRLTE